MKKNKVFCIDCDYGWRGECQHPKCFEYVSTDLYSGENEMRRIDSNKNRNRNFDCKDFTKKDSNLATVLTICFFLLFFFVCASGL